MSNINGLFGRGFKVSDFENKGIQENVSSFGKPVDYSIDKFSFVAFKGYKIEYLNKEGDVIIHFFTQSRWPENFIDAVRSQLDYMHDRYECDFVPEVNSWYVRVFGFSMKRFGTQADAAYISSLLDTL